MPSWQFNPITEGPIGRKGSAPKEAAQTYAISTSCLLTAARGRSGRVTLSIVDLWRPLRWYLLIWHLHTLGWIVLPVLMGWVAGAIFLHTAASAAVDAQVL
jgi:hypothetical protein